MSLGWLDRNGKFYGCNFREHDKLAIELIGDGGEKALEKLGWMSLKGDAPIGKFYWFYLADHPPFPSQKQWDFVFDWCKRYKKEFPPNHLQFLWEDQEK